MSNDIKMSQRDGNGDRLNQLIHKDIIQPKLEDDYHEMGDLTSVNTSTTSTRSYSSYTTPSKSDKRRARSSSPNWTTGKGFQCGYQPPDYITKIVEVNQNPLTQPSPLKSRENSTSSVHSNRPPILTRTSSQTSKLSVNDSIESINMSRTRSFSLVQQYRIDDGMSAITWGSCSPSNRPPYESLLEMEDEEEEEFPDVNPDLIIQDTNLVKMINMTSKDLNDSFPQSVTFDGNSEDTSHVDGLHLEWTKLAEVENRMKNELDFAMDKVAYRHDATTDWYFKRGFIKCGDIEAGMDKKMNTHSNKGGGRLLDLFMEKMCCVSESNACNSFFSFEEKKQ